MTTHSFRRMKELFEQIRITDLDIDLTQTSQEASGLRRLYLKLSGEPPPEWVRIFEKTRRFPRDPVWRNAWVVGAHIVIDCVPEELERSGLNHLHICHGSTILPRVCPPAVCPGLNVVSQSRKAVRATLKEVV